MRLGDSWEYWFFGHNFNINEDGIHTLEPFPDIHFMSGKEFKQIIS